MSSCSAQPSSRLAPFVRSLWYHEGGAPPYARERVLPGGGFQLLVNLDEDVLHWWEGSGLRTARDIRGCGIGGVRTRTIGISTRDQRRIVGVEFASGGAASLLDLPATELADTTVDLAELWGVHGRVLRERLLEAGSPAATLATLDAALVERLQPGAQLDPAVRYATEALARGCRVAELDASIGMSARRFRERFASIVGVRPKLFSRLQRLQRALGMRESSAHWTEVAHASGYHDQAHLVREFREFTGIKPSDYAPTSGHNHVVLND